MQMEHDADEAACHARMGQHIGAAGIDGDRLVAFVGRAIAQRHVPDIGRIGFLRHVHHHLVRIRRLRGRNDTIEIGSGRTRRHQRRFYVITQQVVDFMMVNQRQAGQAQQQHEAGTDQTAPAPAEAMQTVVISASADASAHGLTQPYAGVQVVRGGRLGLLGNVDMMDTPFNTINYTHELIQDQQAKSVADVLQNDPSVRVARGFGIYQELYMIRGFAVNSDDLAYNGLYGLLPHQYVAAELLERVDVFRGANSFLNGAAPGGGGIGGTINLLPKRARATPLTQLKAGVETGGQGYGALDIGRRFGPDNNTGIRINAVRRDGDTGVDGEQRALSVLSVGLDYDGGNFRVSADHRCRRMGCVRRAQRQ